MEHQLNLTSVIEQVGKEKNIDRDVLVSALEAAMFREIGNANQLKQHFRARDTSSSSNF